MKNRVAFAAITMALVVSPCFNAFAGQSAAVQKPPRITSNSLFKPKATPGKFRPATLPMTLTPEKPVNESGALVGFGSFDLTEGKITVRSGEAGHYTGQYAGLRVMLAKTGRPVTVEFDIYGTAKADDKIRLQLYEQVRKPDGKYESKTLNMTTVEVFSLRQRLSISGTPSGEGWIWATATPRNEGTTFDLMAITVKEG
jgi:hypothetical protein